MPYLNSCQKELFLNFLTENPEMETKKFGPNFTKKKYQDLWKELADQLNSIPNGAKKEWMKWRKTWTDMKKNSKGKLAKARKYEGGTGGGPPVDPELSAVDKKILDLMSPVCLGDLEIVEPEIMYMEEDDLFKDHNYVSGINIEPETDNTKENTPYTSPICCQSNSAAGSLSLPKTIPLTINNTTMTSMKKSPDPHTRTTANTSSLRETVPFTEKLQSITRDITPHPAGPVTPKVFRVTKTMRLNESVKNNKKFMTISEDTLTDTKNYHIEKLRILKDYYQFKQKNLERESVTLEGIRQTFERQTVALENISKSFAAIAETVAELL